MKASLSGAAANVLWDTAEDKLNSLQKLVDVLATRFDSAETAERYRGELRTRKRRQGESLQSLHQDVQRLTSLAFRGPWSEAIDVIARDAFIDALLDVDLALKIREREPATLDETVKTAIRLESYSRSSAAKESTAKRSTQQARAASSDNYSAAKFDQLQLQLQLTQARLAELEKRPTHNQFWQPHEQLTFHSKPMWTQPPGGEHTLEQTPNQAQSVGAASDPIIPPSSRRRNLGLCYACGQAGHFS